MINNRRCPNLKKTKLTKAAEVEKKEEQKEKKTVKKKEEQLQVEIKPTRGVACSLTSCIEGIDLEDISSELDYNDEKLQMHTLYLPISKETLYLYSNFCSRNSLFMI